MRRATWIGATAIAAWSTLAALTTLTGALPPFETVAITFLVGSVCIMAASLVRGVNPLHHLRIPLRAWVLGVGGLFGYHALYFLALKSAPPVEANLINYLWPLLLVLGTALLPGERLRWNHVVGTLIGLAGTVLLITRDGGFNVKPEYVTGYAAALACAVTWSAYSVLSRRLGSVPADTVAWTCLATSILGFLVHFSTEITVWPADARAWGMLVLMGAGPVGLAFVAWDVGMKHGDIKALGAMSYATPVLSTMVLIALGKGTSHPVIWMSCALVVVGAVLASWKVTR